MLDTSVESPPNISLTYEFILVKTKIPEINRILLLLSIKKIIIKIKGINNWIINKEKNDLIQTLKIHEVELLIKNKKKKEKIELKLELKYI